eukprot:Amastigsp_a512484_49.p5 type:complete len:141 gc:universal Amastigsp_a512484_49:657-235(-)
MGQIPNDARGAVHARGEGEDRAVEQPCCPCHARGPLPHLGRPEQPRLARGPCVRVRRRGGGDPAPGPRVRSRASPAPAREVHPARRDESPLCARPQRPQVARRRARPRHAREPRPAGGDQESQGDRYLAARAALDQDRGP